MSAGPASEGLPALWSASDIGELQRHRGRFPRALQSQSIYRREVCQAGAVVGLVLGRRAVAECRVEASCIVDAIDKAADLGACLVDIAIGSAIDLLVLELGRPSDARRRDVLDARAALGIGRRRLRSEPAEPMLDG